MVKDIEDRQLRKNPDPNKRKITDITLLKTIARYLASVVGSPVSVKSVSDYLVSSGRKVSPNTVDDYMEALQESFIFYPVERFDINGKQLLKLWPIQRFAGVSVCIDNFCSCSFDSLRLSFQTISLILLLPGAYSNITVFHKMPFDIFEHKL